MFVTIAHYVFLWQVVRFLKPFFAFLVLFAFYMFFDRFADTFWLFLSCFRVYFWCHFAYLWPLIGFDPLFGPVTFWCTFILVLKKLWQVHRFSCLYTFFPVKHLLNTLFDTFCLLDRLFAHSHRQLFGRLTPFDTLWTPWCTFLLTCGR